MMIRGTKPMSDTRLIERWMPIAALGEESVRERRSMTALPPTYYLHVWWARRPLWLLGRRSSHPCYLRMPTGRSSCMCWGFMGIR